MFTRRNVWELGDDWAEPILWYARGVAAMQARPLAEPTSWRFYGGIHGFHAGLWQALGYLDASDQPPSAALVQQFWLQCQHGSWYFLPWHRGYVLAFEANVRVEVASLDGPSDWALPYWNYFKDGQAALPPAFASPDWPDGTGTNPLFVEARFGPNNDGNVFIPTQFVNLDALDDPSYTGVASGGSTGFGGVDTGFSHSGQVHGGIETQPHDFVHGLIGGENPTTELPGVMSVPASAGLDPIFWLHHANIDRLWEVWSQSDPAHVDPTGPAWVDGPASIGERPFVMPMPAGGTFEYTPGQVVDTATLGYEYDDVSAPVTRAIADTRAARAGAGAGAGPEGAASVANQDNVELVGASSAPLPVRGSEAKDLVRLDTGVRRRVAASRSNVRGAAATRPDRVFLNLEHVRGRSDATAFRVYVGLPDDADPDEHPERLAGSIALFGVRQASERDDEHAGQGLTYVLEITKIVDDLHLESSLDVDTLPVRILPINPVSDAADVTIGRISVFRQGS